MIICEIRPEWLRHSLLTLARKTYVGLLHRSHFTAVPTRRGWINRSVLTDAEVRRADFHFGEKLPFAI